ncbi:MAG: FliM/FliN family flagellar motor C-terminal domain-containing protein [Terriglobales bacterium]
MDTAAQLAKEPESKPVADAGSNLIESFGWLPCQLSIEIPAVRFTVGDLLRLNQGSIVETGCPDTGDIPLRVNGLLIAWTEFDVSGNQLAVRITELV